MSKFFVESDQIKDNIITITGEDAYHINKVLRMGLGDKITICDGKGLDYIASIKTITKDSVVVEIIETCTCSQEPKISVVLFQGLPKSDKMDYIIQKCVELGVARIVPIITARTVVKLKSKDDVIKKVQRWNKISAEASKQCNRGIIPIVDDPVDLIHAAQIAASLDFCFVTYEKEKQYSIKDTLIKAKGLLYSENHSKYDSRASKPHSIGFFVGPEGGFEEYEIELLKNYNIYSASLGPRILRTETAGICIISCIMYEFDNLC